MKNIGITILKDGKELAQYTADLIPNVGDCVEIKNSGTYIVTDRTFVAANNKVKIFVEDIML